MSRLVGAHAAAALITWSAPDVVGRLGRTAGAMAIQKASDAIVGYAENQHGVVVTDTVHSRHIDIPRRCAVTVVNPDRGALTTPVVPRRYELV